MFPCICNAMCHCKLMPCPTCNECHMDNINHTIYLVSWTIISHAYNFQKKNIHSMLIHLNTHINIHQSQQQACYHISSNNTLKPRGKMWHLGCPQQQPNNPLIRALKMATKSTKQAFKQATIPAKPALISTGLIFFNSNKP